MSQIHETATHLALSKTELAVQLFEEQYGNTMEISNQLIAFEIFENLRKAELFITMRGGTVRDAWLEQEISRHRTQ